MRGRDVDVSIFFFSFPARLLLTAGGNGRRRRGRSGKLFSSPPHAKFSKSSLGLSLAASSLDPPPLSISPLIRKVIRASRICDPGDGEER